eukprot:4527529-Pyramimonas_sp.AAC.1
MKGYYCVTLLAPWCHGRLYARVARASRRVTLVSRRVTIVSPSEGCTCVTRVSHKATLVCLRGMRE